MYRFTLDSKPLLLTGTIFFRHILLVGVIIIIIIHLAGTMLANMWDMIGMYTLIGRMKHIIMSHINKSYPQWGCPYHGNTYIPYFIGSAPTNT